VGWLIDTETGDYVLTDGHFERDASPATAIYLRLFTRRGEYLADPTFGSRLHELARYKRADRAARDLPAMVQEALAPLVREGRLSSVDVVAEVLGPDGVAGAIEAYDSGRRPYTFQLFQEVGG